MIELAENLYLTDLDGKDENYYLVIKSSDENHGEDFIESSEERRAYLYVNHYEYMDFNPNLYLECALFFIRRGIDAERKVFIVTKDERDKALKLGFLYEMAVNQYTDDEIEDRFYDYFKRINILPVCRADDFKTANSKIGGALWRM